MFQIIRPRGSRYHYQLAFGKRKRNTNCEYIFKIARLLNTVSKIAVIRKIKVVGDGDKASVQIHYREEVKKKWRQELETEKLYDENRRNHYLPRESWLLSSSTNALSN